MADFDAAPVELQMCGSALSEISNDLSAELNTLRTEIDGLLGSGWRGQAANGFAQGWDWWQAGAREVLNGLRDMAELLRETGRNYQSTDVTAADDLRGSGAGL